MRYERDGLLLPTPLEKPVDYELIDSFDDLHERLQATYEALSIGQDRKLDVIQAWHEGIDADLSANDVNSEEYKTRLAALKSWKRDLVANGAIDPTVKQAYRWRINEDIANLNMILASKEGDMRQFQRWNEFVYGKPDEAIYRAGLDWIANDADSLLAVPDQHSAITAAAQKVKDMLSDNRGYRELLMPDSEVYRSVRDDHFRDTGFYGLVLAGVDIPSGKVSSQQGEPILQRMVTNNLESDYRLRDAAGASWSVSHHEKAVKRPKTYNMPTKRFIGLGMGHEIGTHLLERMNGERGPLGLLVSGMDRYEVGNEGRAVIREQVPYETFNEFSKQVRWRDIIRRHIAISHAAGTNETPSHSSAETYAFMNAIDTMYQSKLTADDPEMTREKSRTKTDSLLLRVLKGTDGTTGAYLKDKVYLEGNVACWMEAATRGHQAISDGDFGKFDIHNPRHLAVLQKVGLLPNEE